LRSYGDADRSAALINDGPSRGRPWTSAAPAPARHAVELAHEGVPLNVIQRQLGHANLGTTSIYLPGIENAEIIGTVHSDARP
jgi:site-specific recombinase XerD